MYKVIYSMITVISCAVMIASAIYLLKTASKIERDFYFKPESKSRKNRISMSKPEYSMLVESYKEGYRYVVKDAHERKLIFFEEEPIKCGAAWLSNAGGKVKHVDYWNSKDSLNKEPKYSSDLFSMVFDFIDEKSENLYLIEELLKS